MSQELIDTIRALTTAVNTLTTALPQQPTSISGNTLNATPIKGTATTEAPAPAPIPPPLPPLPPVITKAPQMQFAPVVPVKEYKPCKVALIVGHSSTSGGAVNKLAHAAVNEYEFNNALVKEIVEAFNRTVPEEQNITLEIVYRDNGYAQLPSDVNKTKADFAISFHCNAFNTKASGTEMLYYHSSDNSKMLAGIALNNVVNALNLPDRGIKPKHSEDRGGYLLRETNMPCIISEAFFIDNIFDLARAQSAKSGLVNAYIDTILEYADWSDDDGEY